MIINLTQKANDVSIVATQWNSQVILDDLVRQFKASELSYDQLWVEIERNFSAEIEDSSISNGHISVSI